MAIKETRLRVSSQLGADATSPPRGDGRGALEAVPTDLSGDLLPLDRGRNGPMMSIKKRLITNGIQ